MAVGAVKVLVLRLRKSQLPLFGERTPGRVRAHTRKLESGKVAPVHEHASGKAPAQFDLLGWHKPEPKPAPVVEPPKDAPAPAPSTPEIKVAPPPKSGRHSRLKHTEIGEHVWGSAKDKWDLRTGTIDAFKDLDPVQRAALAKKAKISPKLDWETYRENGVDPGAAYLADVIYSIVAPAAEPAHQAEYIEGIRLLLPTMLAVKKAADWFPAVRELQALRRGAVFPSHETYASVTEAKRAAEAMLASQSVYKESGYMVVDGEWAPYLVDTDKRDYYARLCKALGRKFDSAMMGGLYMHTAASNARRIDEMGWDKFIEMKTRKSGGGRRKGPKYTTVQAIADTPERIGGRQVPQEANAKRLAETFGMRRNIQYGMSMTNADREFHLHRAEEALHDLADVLGIDPAQVSLNGRLSLAFGARGKGKARAHYELTNKIINITRFAGGGTIAHEWGHFLDNILAESNGLTDKASRLGGAMLTHALREDTAHAAALKQAAPDLYEAAQGVNRALRLTPDGKSTSDYYSNARRLESKASFSTGNRYWSNEHELFARAFEAYVQDELELNGRRNSYLVDGTRTNYVTGRGGWRAPPYPLGAEREHINAAIKHFIEVARTGGHFLKAILQMGLFDGGTAYSAPGRVKAHERVTPSGKVVQVAEHARAPKSPKRVWEHTRAEWRKDRAASNKARGIEGTDRATTGPMADQIHRDEVRRAHEGGHDVPAHVLAEYAHEPWAQKKEHKLVKVMKSMRRAVDRFVHPPAPAAAAASVDVELINERELVPAPAGSASATVTDELAPLRKSLANLYADLAHARDDAPESAAAIEQRISAVAAELADKGGAA